MILMLTFLELYTNTYRERICLPSLVLYDASENPDTRPGVFMSTDGVGTVQRNFRKHLFLQRNQQLYLVNIGSIV